MPRMPTKYRAIKTRVDGIVFASKKEADYYIRLKMVRDSLFGDIAYFLRQVPFDLPGGTKYRVDFQIFYKSGLIQYIDVKGYETPAFKRAKRQVEALYPVTIETR